MQKRREGREGELKYPLLSFMEVFYMLLKLYFCAKEKGREGGGVKIPPPPI